MRSGSTAAWLVFGAALVAAQAVDLLAHRHRGNDSRSAAVGWSAFWIGLGLAFCVAVAATMGARAANTYLSVYLLEKSLSIDNLAVFLIIFSKLQIPLAQQRRLLTLGITLAVLLRGGFILAGVAMVRLSRHVLDVFAVLLAIVAVQMLRGRQNDSEAGTVEWLRARLRFTRHLWGDRFFVHHGHRWIPTPLLVALLAIETSDLLFACDSIPSAFALTDDLFLLLTANLFAVSGLRALYVAIAMGLRRTRGLQTMTAIILLLVAAKMITDRWVHWPPIAVSVVLVVCLAVAWRLGVQDNEPK